MTDYNYTLGIPAGPNNPSDDQPNMQTNNDNIAALINEDHITFNMPNGGLHRQTRMIAQNTIPAGLLAGMGTFYVKVVNGEEQVFYTSGANGTEYQITNSIQSNYSTFGTFLVPPMPSTQGAQGWTFLPGGLLFQYGQSGVANVTFPVTFTTSVYSINITKREITSTSALPVNSSSVVGFATNTTPGLFFWTAIGK